jgi:hypothetical protein
MRWPEWWEWELELSPQLEKWMVDRDLTDMKERYLQITFRNGKPLAAYLYLPRQAGVKSARTVEAASGVLVDYAPSGEPIGLEITTPSHVTVDQVNTVLESLGLSAIAPEELAPLHTA